jgi:hypothetical protein
MKEIYWRKLFWNCKVLYDGMNYLFKDSIVYYNDDDAAEAIKFLNKRMIFVENNN